MGFEQNLRDEVNNYLKNNNLTIQQMARSKEVNYTNTTKLMQFFNEGKGSITTQLVERIKNFIK